MTDEQKIYIHRPAVLSLARAASALGYAELNPPDSGWTAHDLDEALRLLSEVAGSLEKLAMACEQLDQDILRSPGVEAALVRTAGAFGMAKREIDDLRYLREVTVEEEKQEAEA